MKQLLVNALVAAMGGDVWAECPNYPRNDWQHEVANGDTNQGYWEWVIHQVEEKEGTIDRLLQGSTASEVEDYHYAKKQGNRCPFCGSENISGHSVDVDGDTATQEIGCDDCHKSWDDMYRLVGFKARRS